jgi:hypothetical protein
MEPTALLPLRRKACWEFLRLKNPTASAVCEPANLGTKGQHVTSRPPKLLFTDNSNMFSQYDNKFRTYLAFAYENTLNCTVSLGFKFRILPKTGRGEFKFILQANAFTTETCTEAWRQNGFENFWHVYVLVGAYFVWPWKSREPSVTLTSSHRGLWPLLIRVSGITWRGSKLLDKLSFIRVT